MVRGLKTYLIPYDIVIFYSLFSYSSIARFDELSSEIRKSHHSVCTPIKYAKIGNTQFLEYFLPRPTYITFLTLYQIYLNFQT